MEEEKKSFVIKDRRIFDESGAARKEEEQSPKAAPSQAEPAAAEGLKEEKERPAEKQGPEERTQEFRMEINFSNFLLSLSTSALLYFGDIPDPATQQARKNLPAAKEIIDTLSMLKMKTEGNLDQNEKNLLEGMLYELRMRFVKENR